MKKTARIIKKLFCPPLGALIPASLAVFSALVFIFAYGLDDTAPAYVVYCMSAYCLAALIIPLPRAVRAIKLRTRRRIADSEFGEKYIDDPAFRGRVGIYRGMTLNFLYVIFRVYLGIRYASVWFITMAVYYLVLGALRLSLIIGCRCRTRAREIACYRRTAWALFVLNIPMAGMIILMIFTDSGYSYPGYVIYLSAAYTFCTAILSVVNIVKYRRLGSPVLSASKVLNSVAALMSLLGLQTAMLAQFSAGDIAYHRMMNAITGGGVWLCVIAVAVYMLCRSQKMKAEVSGTEPFGE